MENKKKVAALEHLRTLFLAVAASSSLKVAELAIGVYNAITELDDAKVDKDDYQKTIDAIISGRLTVPMTGRDGVGITTRDGEEILVVKLL